MEWVETTGKTIEEAKDAALDQLGVDEQDAEFSVVEEPRTGLFGRTRGEARVRARVKPTQPRPKLDRRERKGRSGGRGGRGGDRGRQGSRSKGGSGGGNTRPKAPGGGSGASGGSDDARPATASEGPDEPTAPARKRGNRGGGGRGNRSRSGNGASGEHTNDDQETRNMTETEVAAQGEIVREFLLDLLDAFGLDGEVTARLAEEGAVELDVTGDDLGLLIGPKGQTLQAIQELSRSVLQRQQPGEVHARVRIDVGGYRQRRREALERFVTEIAEEVRRSGTRKALEPMSPPDRKVVHDTVNEIDGVRTQSEGEDARRRVVILPDD